jgi:hypothetical protein
MPLPAPSTFYRCDMGFVWAVSAVTLKADASEAKVLLVSMPVHDDDMGTMANEWTTAEWEQYRVEYGLTPCPHPPPMLRSTED